MECRVSDEYIRNAVRFLKEDYDEETPASVDDNPGVPGVADEFELDDLNLEEPEGEETETCVDCPDCGGTGKVTDEDGNEVDCETCGGEGCVAVEDAEFDFDPSTGVCPCCGCKLNVIEPTADSLAGEEEVPPAGEEVPPEDGLEDGLESDDLNFEEDQ